MRQDSEGITVEVECRNIVRSAQPARITIALPNHRVYFAIPSGACQGRKCHLAFFPQNQYNSIREQSGLTRVPVLGFSSPLLEAKTEYTRIDAEEGNMGAA
jgi:hypothetical protein